MLLNWYIGLIVRPVSTLREIVDARPLGLGLLTLLIVTILNGIVTFGLGIDTATFEEFTDENIAIGPAFVVVGAILFTIFTAIGTVLFTLVVHLISRLFGGNGAYTGMLAGLMIISILSLILVIPGAAGCSCVGGRRGGRGRYIAIRGDFKRYQHRSSGMERHLGNHSHPRELSSEHGDGGTKRYNVLLCRSHHRNHLFLHAALRVHRDRNCGGHNNRRDIRSKHYSES